MPVLSCPKCPTKLKVPDGVSGNTRCPKCGTVFPVVKPAFEVVDEPKKPAPKPATKTAPPLPPPPPSKPSPAFEVVSETKKKRVVDDDDDDEEEDRPRKKRRSREDDDDEDDDRPRSSKKRRRDDDDDDDRPRKKKGGKRKRYYDDDEDDDTWRPRGGGAGEFAKAKTGALLIGLSYWMNLAAYGLLALYVLIAWLLVAGASASSGSSSSRGGGRSGSSGEGSGEFLEMLVILPGLIGLCAWLVGLIGCSFAIAGPRKARGMAITATVFAAVHLLLVGVTFSNLQEGMGGIGRELPGVGKVAWIAVASLLPAVDTFLPTLFYQSKSIGSDYVIALLAGAAEVGRLIFGLLALKALAAAAKDYDASERSGYGMMIVIGVIGGVVVLTLLVAVLLAEGKFKSLNTYLNLGLGTVFLMYLAYALMMLSPAIAAFGTKDACARRA